ncbi:response regulator transcription factor [Christensenella intestinihominis]|uniref:response regulator transcription factor n=1 Tax=Christensenella intestinihominis TaxID=1851429 RepID=UPI000837881D|nr:response regulator [Christensenella intestinihominis]
MFKILIADDEPIAREAIATIIRKHLLEKIEILQAKSGREAVEKAGTLQPDIVCMDIRMPGLNGIDTIQELKRRYPEMIFIVITAFDDFDTVVAALKLGVQDYFLKPIKIDDLVRSLQKAIGQIMQRQDEREEALNLKDTVSKLMPELEKELIYTLFIGNTKRIYDYGYLRLLGIGTECGGCFGIRMADGGDEAEQRAAQRIRRYVKNHCSGVSSSLQNGKMIVFLFEDILMEDREFWLHECAKNLMQAAQCEHIFLSVAPYSTSLGELRESYLTVAAGLEDSNGNEGIVFCKTWNSSLTEKKTDYPFKLEDVVFQEIKQGRPQAAREKTVQLFEALARIAQGSQKKLAGEIQKFVAALIRFRMSVEAEEDTNSSFDLFTDPVELMNRCLQEVEALCHIAEQTDKETANKSIKKAIEYIRENYKNNISMCDVADHVGLSPFYFTKIFKAEIGMTFVRYLTALRIENAKNIMKNDPSVQIKELCYQVGYNDPKYFCRAFRSIEKQSPTEYRLALKRKK